MSYPAITLESLRRVRFAPILTATVLTVLLLWLFGTAAHVLLLLFLGILLALYLGALRDFLMRRLRVPPRLAYVAALLLTIGALTLLFAILVPPVMEQTQQLISTLPALLTQWEIDGLIEALPGGRYQRVR